MTTAQFPPGRYGRRRADRQTRRWLVPALTALVVVLGVLGVVVYARAHSTGADGQVEMVTAAGDTVTVTVRIRKSPPSLATCTVVARDDTGAQVGTAKVSAGPSRTGSRTVRSRAVITTSARASTADVVGCRETSTGG